MVTRICVLVGLVALASGSPAKTAFWKGTPLDSTVEEMRSACNNDDALSCVKFKFMSFLDNVFKKDTFKLSDDVEVTRNDHRANELEARGSGFEDRVQEYMQSHDVTFKLPFESQVTLGARNLDSDELDLKLKFSESARGKKSKLKKIIVPIMIFILLKAMTLIPLALGVLGLKAWNALQLSFFSFVISVALAVFQLCKKIAHDNAHPAAISAHPWDSYSSHYAARSMDVAQPQTDGTQQMAYSAYY